MLARLGAGRRLERAGHDAGGAGRLSDNTVAFGGKDYRHVSAGSQQGGVMVNDEKVANIDVSFTGEQLKEGLKIRKGKKVFHKAILK